MSAGSRTVVRRAAPGLAALGLVLGVLGLVRPAAAHHAIAAKFDESKPMTLSGIVTLVDWRNPHVHVFINVPNGQDAINWAIEFESPIDLRGSGWSPDTLRPGDRVTVEGPVARDGSRQIWGRRVTGASGRPLFTVTSSAPPAPLAPRPVPRWPNGRPRLGPVPGGVEGYWGFPTETALVEEGVEVETDRYGQLANLSDAAKVAPMQPWALALYQNRQRRSLQDDPMYLNCKPPGGPRQFQISYGVQLVEDPDRQRVFVLMGGGNANYRLMYLDGREQVGQVTGDDDNPLYYGRSVGQWEGDTLVIDTRGFNEDFWFTNGGLPHTSQLRLVERFTRTTYDTLDYEVTIDDVGAYTRPWTAKWTLNWVTGQDLPRHLCQENRP